jgi:hypothetical protein
VWTCLKKGLAEEVTNEVRRMTLTKDSTAAIFDVPKTRVKEFLEISKKWTVRGTKKNSISNNIFYIDIIRSTTKKK